VTRSIGWFEVLPLTDKTGNDVEKKISRDKRRDSGPKSWCGRCWGGKTAFVH